MDLFFALCGAKNSVWIPLRSAPGKTGRCFLTVPAMVLGPRSSGFALLALHCDLVRCTPPNRIVKRSAPNSDQTKITNLSGLRKSAVLEFQSLSLKLFP